MDRKWIVLVALIALTLALGCTSNPPPPPATQLEARAVRGRR